MQNSLMIFFSPRFDLSFSSAVVKTYSFATLCWVENNEICRVKKNENMWPNKFPQPIGQKTSLSYWNTIYCLRLIVSQPQPTFIWLNNNNKVQNMFTVNDRTTRRSSIVFFVNFEYICQIVLVFFLLALNM